MFEVTQYPNIALLLILNKDQYFSIAFLVSTEKGTFPARYSREVFLIQERSDVAQEIINVVKKSKGKMVRDIERLCDAYIILAYMDASRHKTEKSE